MVKIGVWPALNFWLGVNFTIYTLVLIAFGYRLADLAMEHKHGESSPMRTLSFQFLSSAAPLVWMKLLVSGVA